MLDSGGGFFNGGADGHEADLGAGEGAASMVALVPGDSPASSERRNSGEDMSCGVGEKGAEASKSREVEVGLPDPRQEQSTCGK